MAKRKALTELHVALTASTQRFKSSMKSASGSMHRFNSAAKRTSGAMAGLKRAIGPLAAAAGIGGLTVGIGKAMKSIDDLAKSSDRVGVATDALIGLRHAANQMGASSEELDKGLQNMNRRLSEAAEGSGEAKGALEKLGLDAQKLASMTPDQAFKSIADAISGVSNQADKTAIAFDIFGRSGVNLLNTLSLGSDGLDAMSAEADKLGLSMSRVDAAQVEAANDAIDEMRKAFVGVFQRLAVDLAPSLKVIAELVTGIGAGSSQTLRENQDGLGILSRVIGFIGDAIQSIRWGFAKLWQGVYKAISWVLEQLDKGIRKLVEIINLIPGVEMAVADLDFTFGMKEFADYGAEYWKQVADDAASAESFTDRIRRAQAEVAREAEKTRKTRELEAMAAASIAEKTEEVVELNRELDPILASIRRQTEEPEMFGPPVPDGMDQRSEVRGGFSIVDALSNLVTGASTAISSVARPATDESVRKLAAGISTIDQRLSGGEVTVILAGVEA